MWMDKLPSGKYNYIERYIDPMTGKKKRVSIAFDKNTAKNRKIEYYGAAEPPVRCGESHLSGLTEPPHFIY